jgi:oxygen-independent coproporphyrinogen-3 oxidase
MSSPTMIQKYARPVPRYTSYPTAPHFHDGVSSDTYRTWLNELTPDAALSLYVHIPFCDTLCWFCGCQTKQIQRYSPVADYLPALFSEIETIGKLVGSSRPVTHIHWGGGSPTILTPADIKRLSAMISASFAVNADTEFAVEIDPRGFGRDEAEALASAGLTRASIGVQDFSPKVQKAINRLQSFEETSATVAMLREAGVTSINMDLVYGLPFQSDDDLAMTIDQVIKMRPDRVAVFGYAHVPWMKPHQRLIPDDSLPGAVARFEQMELAAVRFKEAGYLRIGIDHFALRGDSLAKAAEDRSVRRNFQGYTTDTADALIGLGASSISRLPQGYAQNEKATGQYQERVARDGLAVVKGITLTADDRMRGWFIERLLSDFRVSLNELKHRFGPAAQDLIDEASRVAAEESQLFKADHDHVAITAQGRPFARTIAARFDAYLATGVARHSVAV